MSFILTLVIFWMTQLLAGVTAFTFQQCRISRRNVDQVFTISSCPSGHIIRIQSAEVGYNTKLLRDRSRCSQKDVVCRRSTQHADIMRCNGQRTCSFSNRVLTFPQGNVQKLCSRHRDGNFIMIDYSCLNGPMDNRMPMKEMIFATSASSADVSNSSFDGVNETVTTSARESSLFVSLRTLTKGEIIALIVSVLLLLLALVTFLIIIICMCRRACNKTKSTQEASTSTEPAQYYNIGIGGGIQPSEDAVTPDNNYESLQRQHLHLYQLRSAVAAYSELIPTGARR